MTVWHILLESCKTEGCGDVRRTGPGCTWIGWRGVGYPRQRHKYNTFSHRWQRGRLVLSWTN